MGDGRYLPLSSLATEFIIIIINFYADSTE